jgi:hypothetical protein
MGTALAHLEQLSIRPTQVPAVSEANGGLVRNPRLRKGRRSRPGGGSRPGQGPISAHLSDSDASYMTGAHFKRIPSDGPYNLPRYAKRLARSRREAGSLRSLGRASVEHRGRRPVISGGAG